MSVTLTAIKKASIFNTAVNLNTNFFAADIVPVNMPAVFRISVCMSVAGTFILRRKVGATTVSENLNLGTALVANAAYLFDVLVEQGESINLQHSATGTILSCKVAEIIGMVGTAI
jgi:hypothetical protein